jgi:hypothetical protein
MSPFDRDSDKHLDSSGAAPRDPSAASSSHSDADDAAAVIANLVRRTGERHAAPATPATAHPDVTAPQPPVPDPPVAQPATQRFAQPATPESAPPATQLFARPVTQQVDQPVRQPVAQPMGQPDSPWARPAMRQPSRRVLVAGGAIAVLLIAGGFALSRPDGSQAKPTAPIATRAAPAAYTVQVTDEITDCAGHSHGRTRSSFKTENCVKATRFLAIGQVSGRPTLYVVSRIQMASADAAASVKQVLDGSGTGNLNDLLREGKTFQGAPSTMPDSGYASVQTGAVVVVSEAGFVHGPSSNTDPALRAAAARVGALVTAGK